MVSKYGPSDTVHESAKVQNSSGPKLRLKIRKKFWQKMDGNL